MSGTGRYLFAVARDVPADSLRNTPGLRGTALEVVALDDLQAVVCDVDLGEFGEEALRRNLEDIHWVEEVARTHDDVVRAVAATGAVAPMRLVTIYADDDGLRRQLDQVHDDLAAALDRVTGSAEWSVKVFARPGTASEEERPREASGAAYLKRKREMADARRASEHQADEIARELHDALRSCALAARALPSQDPRLSGRPQRMIHNGAYLVPHAQTDVFRTTAESWTASHPELEVEVQGPWPPYSFAVLESG
jgi:hypothetical protein